jgi:hypothetical protein
MKAVCSAHSIFGGSAELLAAKTSNSTSMSTFPAISTTGNSRKAQLHQAVDR